MTWIALASEGVCVPGKKPQSPSTSLRAGCPLRYPGFPVNRRRPVVKALEKGRVQPMYAKIREQGAPVQGERLGGRPGKRRTKGQPSPGRQWANSLQPGCFDLGVSGPWIGNDVHFGSFLLFGKFSCRALGDLFKVPSEVNV
jgi:hypothetical protein